MTKIWKHICLAVIIAVVLSVAVVMLPVTAVSVSVDFSATPTSGNAPLTVQFENLSDIFVSNGVVLASIGYTWLWDFGDGDTSTEESPSHTYNCAGEYDVSLTRVYELRNGESAQNDNGGDTETKYNYITVDPVADFTASPTAGEAPLTVQFRDQSLGCPSSWYWSFDDGGTSRDRYPTHTYQNSGSYSVSLTVEGSRASTKVRDFYIIVEEGAFPARLVVRDLNISTVQAQPRQEIRINANVFNEGGSWGSQPVDLLINEQFEQTVNVGVAPGTVQPVSFTVYKVEAGEYAVRIGDAAGTFYVIGEVAQEAPRTGLLAGGELDTGGIIAIVVIAIILVGGLVVAIMFTRRA